MTLIQDGVSIRRIDSNKTSYHRSVFSHDTKSSHVLLSQLPMTNYTYIHCITLLIASV